MSEISQFTDKSPADQKGSHIDTGEHTRDEELSQNQKRMHLGAFVFAVLREIKLPSIREWRREIQALTESGRRYNNGVDIAYGLKGSSMDMCVNVPSMRPLSAKQIEERRKLVAELRDPNFRQREQEFIQGIREAEQRRQSASSETSAS